MYQLRPPATSLARFIEHYWFVTSTPADPVDLRVDVFVDGRADLIFNFGAPYQRETMGGETRQLGKSNLDAQRLVPIRIHQRGAVRLSGVRFHLGGLGPFVRHSLRALTNQTVGPETAFGPRASALEATLRASTSLEDHVARLDAFFEQQLELPRSFEAFERALTALVDSGGSASVAELANAADISSRHVARLFARHLGIAPKRISGVLRFQHSLRLLMRDPGCTLAEVAADAGYYDQAHFIKDFRRMSGGVPRGYRGYYPPESPTDFAPNVVVFLQDDEGLTD
jgi:AraC-like DNA-binding protein